MPRKTNIRPSRATSAVPTKPASPWRSLTCSNDESQPLHRRICRALRQHIALHCKAGDLLPSQNELAQLLQVSFPTVREALSILAEQGVIDRHRGKDTVVLDPHANQHVAILIEQDISHPRTSYYFRRVPQLLRLQLSEHQLRNRLYLGNVEPTHADVRLYIDHPTTCDELIEDLEAQRIRAVVVVGQIGKPLLDRLRAQRIPVVGQEPFLSHYVNVSLPKVLEAGVDCLLKAGRKRLAFMTWSPPNDLLRIARDRNISVNPNWLRYDLNPATPSAGWDEFREIWSSSSTQRPDGLLVADDVLFADALPAILQAQVRVPDDLLIVTYANKGSEPWLPFPVVRLEIDPDEIAHQMADAMVKVLAGQLPDGLQISLGPKVVGLDRPVSLPVPTVHTFK